MKKLKKILLTNWLYFSKQVIEVDDINFLTGKNGAGKSTIIDALQIVLLGETNAHNFNQAANEKSQRTLDGYLRADMDESSPFSRRGKDFSSYIACEFFDDVEGTHFVTGVVFDCRSDGTRQERFFIYDGVIPENCFLESREAMDIPKLRSFLKQIYGVHAKLYDTQKQYRSDMLAKWNVHNEQVSRMLKKAVSFRPIVDIQKFITENICDIPDKPDTEAMQQNIRDYKRHEQLAQRQEEKLASLQEISRLFGEFRTAISRWEEHRFLALWAKKENLSDEIDKHESEREECKENIERKSAEFNKAETLMEQKNQQKNKLTTVRDKNDVFQEREKLLAEKEQLEKEQQRLLSQLGSVAQEIRRETVLLNNLCEKIADWQVPDILPKVAEAAETLQKKYTPFLYCDYNVFSQPLSAFENVQEITSKFAAVIRDASYKTEGILAELMQNKERTEAALSNLRRNIKDYPGGLLQLKGRLVSELKRQTSQDVQIDILSDVIDIPDAEEQWRDAVEAYLNTRRFYLLVEPKYYQKALLIYDQIKHDYEKQSFGLIDIGNLREKEKIAPWDDSLAKKISAYNDLARTYIDYLLGRVVCCDHVSQLRKHRTAITSDGMLYQGYVVRPIVKGRTEDVFIGRRAIELRKNKLRSELESIEKDILIWRPINEQLTKQKNKEYLFSYRFVQIDIRQHQENYLRTKEIVTELENNEERFNGLDLTWLDQIGREIDQLDKDIKALDKQKGDYKGEIGSLEEKIRTLDQEKLPKLRAEFNEANLRIEEEFSQSFTDETGIPRYQQEIQRLKKASVVAKNFGDRLQQTINERDNTRKKLFDARLDYIHKFQPCTFRYDVLNNDEFAAEMRFLEENELPKYREKIKAARESAMEQFQNDFLAKLKSSIDQVQTQVKNLNRALKNANFGTDRYQFHVDRNPDYADYYDMIMAPELMEGDMGLFAFSFQQKYGKLIEELFSRISASDDTQLNARRQSELKQNIERYTDFRTYLKFDLETTDQNGSRQLLSQTLNTKSGGETQTPFYIAVLASFAQMYQVNNLSGLANNTVRLVVFDEAFNKMDSDRIVESINLLRKMHLQAIICTPPDKLSDIMPLADRTFLVSKDKYKMHVLSYGKEISYKWNET